MRGLLAVLCISLLRPFVWAQDYSGVLDRVNALRARHSAPPAVFDATVTSAAQIYADRLAATGVFVHSASRYGENLGAVYADSGPAAATTSVDAFYAENTAYDYGAPGFALGTGHFTQLVWAASTRLGLGTARNENGTGPWYVVFNFDPPGNVVGGYAANVLPARTFSPPLLRSPPRSPPPPPSPRSPGPPPPPPFPRPPKSPPPLRSPSSPPPPSPKPPLRAPPPSPRPSPPLVLGSPEPPSPPSPKTRSPTSPPPPPRKRSPPPSPPPPSPPPPPEQKQKRRSPPPRRNVKRSPPPC